MLNVSQPPLQLLLLTTYWTGVLVPLISSSLRKMKSELPLRPDLPFWAMNPKFALPFTALAVSAIQPPPAVLPVPLPTSTDSDATSMPLVQYGFDGRIRTSMVYGSSAVGTGTLAELA